MSFAATVRRPARRAGPVAALAAVLAALAACVGAPPIDLPPAGTAPGAPLSLTPLGSYPAFALRLIGWSAGIDVPVTSGARLYRVEYWTTGPTGAPAMVSGLAAVPTARAAARGTVSFQHGTIVPRRAAPSSGRTEEALLGSLVFAGGGYLFLAPDYLGLGTSRLPHPYLDAPSEAAAVVDLLKAARTLSASGALPLDFPPDVYLMGFSQGGHAAAAAQRALEAAPSGTMSAPSTTMSAPGFTVVANAAVAAPLSLVNPAGTAPGEPVLAFQNALLGELPTHAYYIAYLASAYCRWYGLDEATVLRPEWSAKIAVAYSGDAPAQAAIGLFETGRGASRRVLAKARDLVAPEFLAAYRAYLAGAGPAPALVERLAANAVLDWRPRAPLRLYYGRADTDVPPSEALAAAAALGPNAAAVDLGEVDHSGSIMKAAPLARAWFDELSAARAGR
jgi:hypothetical protein